VNRSYAHFCGIAGVALGACLLSPLRTAAQDTTLDRVQHLTATGRFTDARNTLAQWEQQYAGPSSNATAADRARALYLRGTLATAAKEAEEAFLGVVLSYPSTDAAPQALLRLGQGLLAGGEAQRAVGYLERLRNDYPRSSARETGWLWLARAQLAAGSAREACTTAREGLRSTRSENLRLLLEIERDRACRTGPSPTTAPAPPPTADAAKKDARFAVQAAAFRERASAIATASQMREKGFDARVVTTPGSDLFRVRFGYFATSAAATDAARRVREAGFTAFVVNDVATERSP
jgi:tetratricopeptide (TPR) repeat protein